jgi:hypothetical protein
MSFFKHKTALVEPDAALPGREQPGFTVPADNIVLGTPQTAPAPEGFAEVWFGTGCFWGTEEIFWQQPGVWTTAVGYAGGYTPYPTYEEVCSGGTGHTEAVRIVFDPTRTSLTAATARSPRRSPRPAPSTMPRVITSSTWRRTRTATGATATPASRSPLRPRPRQPRAVAGLGLR